MLYIYGAGTGLNIGDFSPNVKSSSDENCTMNKNCKGEITVVVEMGNEGKTKSYTLKTNGSRVAIEGTNYTASASITDGMVALNIYGLSMN